MPAGKVMATNSAGWALLAAIAAFNVVYALQLARTRSASSKSMSACLFHYQRDDVFGATLDCLRCLGMQLNLFVPLILAKRHKRTLFVLFWALRSNSCKLHTGSRDRTRLEVTIGMTKLE